jgi:hypothetical protein
MGGTTARIAVAAVAFCGMLSPGALAPAAAAAPLDDAAQAVSAVTQTVDGIAAPATKQAVSTVPDTANVPPPIERATPAQGGDRAAVPATPVHGPRSEHRAGQPGAAAPIARDSRPARGHVRAGTNRPSPPHGRKAMPPARSHAERAAGARSAGRSHAVTSAPRRSPGPRPGLAGAARALESPVATVFAAFLLAALVTFLRFDLRPLRVPAPMSRRLAFVSPIDPPG